MQTESTARTGSMVLNVRSFGYAVFLSISVTSIWGGVYPYFGDAWRTAGMTTAFYVMQIAAMGLSFATLLALSWYRPRAAERVHALGFSVPLATGPLLLIASMYLEAATPVLVIVGAALTGAGSAGFLASWQRVFASLDAAQGTSALIAGTAGSAIIYFCICFIPAALVAYLIPLVMVPLAGLCLWLSAQGTSVKQPMFEDVPREHALIYRNVIRESLLPALSVGALGFCSGSVRFLAISHQELLSFVNIVSMAVLLIIFVAFFLVWRTRTITFSLTTVFRILFPLAATCVVALPFAGAGFTDACAAASYACFMVATVLMMMHCAQISRDSGINPLFIYAFYGLVAYAFQMMGYATGAASHDGFALGVEQLSLVSLATLFVMLMVSLFGRRTYKLRTDRLEFLAPAKTEAGASRTAPSAADEAEQANAATEGAKTTAAATPESDTTGPSTEEAGAARVTANKTETCEPRVRDPHVVQVTRGSSLGASAYEQALDRTALLCRTLAERYGLSSRETEVAELIARGYTGPAIAEALFISENTMRTHNRRIYAKLGVHKKQELLRLLETMDDEA